MLHYQERAVVLLKDGPMLGGGEGPPHYQLHRAAAQPAEDARANAGDEDDPELLQVVVIAVKGPGQDLLGATSTHSVSERRETAGRSSNFQEDSRRAWDIGEEESGGEGETTVLWGLLR
jgi:hypothetical protein